MQTKTIRRFIGAKETPAALQNEARKTLRARRKLERQNQKVRVAQAGPRKGRGRDK
jgi:FtsZ-binding cell division protein ZapB